MATQVQFRRGTTNQTETFIGALGEITVDTDLSTAVIHDGATSGGFSLLRSDGSNSALSRGSAGNCALQFAGDPNTGLFSPGADQVSLVAGSGQLTIDSSGALSFNGNVSINGDLTVTGSSPDNLALIVALS